MMVEKEAEEAAHKDKLRHLKQKLGDSQVRVDVIIIALT